MRKIASFFTLLGVAALAATLTTNDAAHAADPPKVTIAHGRMILLLNPTNVSGKAVTVKHPLYALTSAYTNPAGGFVLGGKKSGHFLGTVAGGTLRAKDPRGITLDGKVAANEKIAAATGIFTIAGTKGTISGSFALVPFTSAGGALIGGASGARGLPNGWGGKGAGGLGQGLGGWGYNGGGLFDGPEQANLGGTTVSGQAADGGILDQLYDWAVSKLSGSSDTGANQAEGAKAISDMAAGQYSGMGQNNMDADTKAVMSGSSTPDERPTYGTGGFNGNLVLKGQDGQGNGFDFPAGAEGFKGIAGKGDNPFEMTSADQLNLQKLFNGASDPASR